MISSSHSSQPPSRLIIQKDCSHNQFLIKHREYTQQYSHIYFCRLKQIKPSLEQKAIQKWSSHSHYCQRILDSQPGRAAFLVGTIYAEQPGRKGILDEIAMEYHLEVGKTASSEESSSSYFSPQNVYYLEDEHGRIQLALPETAVFITGSVVALQGFEGGNGIFWVKDWCFAGLPEQQQLTACDENDDGVELLVVSGLKYSLQDASTVGLEFEMLKDLLVGNLPGVEQMQGLLLCGDSLSEPKQFVDEAQKKRFGAINYKYDTNHFSWFSRTLGHVLRAGKSIVVVPGATDPTNIALPQQPIHSALFKEAAQANEREKLLYLETNPCMLKINGLICLLMDGKSVIDAQKHTNSQDKKEIMRYLLLSRHVAPTAPDTLCCYPCYEEDPFVLSQCPNVVICGGAGAKGQLEEFWIEGEEGQKVFVIFVPDFSTTKQALKVTFGKKMHVVPIRMGFANELLKGSCKGLI